MKLIVCIVCNDKGELVERATVRLNVASSAWACSMTDASGMCSFFIDDSLQDTQLEVYTCNYKDYGTHINLGLVGNLQIRIGMQADPLRPQDIILPALENLKEVFPLAPTRNEILSINLAFQGTYVNTNQYGLLPWFEPALAWLNEEDRKEVYRCKKLNGETHCIAFLPSGPSLYDEPNQPYNVFGPLDWTSNNTSIDARFTNFIAEIILNGFHVVIFLNGDDGSRGYEIAKIQLPLVIETLKNNSYKVDLNQYCIIIPGFDGVFYGYTPEQVTAFGNQFRLLSPNGYLGIEHSTGHIPIGNGPDDYRLNGPMSNYDVILGEFNTEVKDDSVWQVLSRMLGLKYKRPSDQPKDDDPNPPFYLKNGTPRGPYYYIVFEYDTYNWVRGMSTVRHLNWKQYLINCGAEFIC